jgi:hypothetical protein
MEEEMTIIDRIVIQQLLQNSAEEAPHSKKEGAEKGRGQTGTLPSSPRSTRSPGSLLAVVEIRDQSNEPVEAVGELSLMVMAVSHPQSGVSDPPDGKPRRLQRWNFSAEEVHQAWQSSPLGDGLHLELPLEGQPLSAEPLELWARLVTPDGQKHLTKLPFDLRHLVALRDAPLTVPEYDGPEQGVPLPSGNAVRLADSTTEKETFWPQEGNPTGHSRPANDHLQRPDQQATPATVPWRKARTNLFNPLRSGATSGHGTTTSDALLRWVAQTGVRHQKTSLANRRIPSVVPSVATRQPPVAPVGGSSSSSPAWTSSR